MRISDWSSDVCSSDLPVRLRMGGGLLDRRSMKVVAGEAAVRKRLGHEQCRKPDPASDLGNPGAALQPGAHVVERGQPRWHACVDIAGPGERSEERREGTELGSTVRSRR